MAVTARDKHGTLTKRRRSDGPQLDRRSARYFAIVDGTWSRGFATRREAESAEREMQSRAESGVNLAAGAMTLAEFLRSVWLAAHTAKLQRGQLKAGSAAHYELMAEKYVIPTLGDKRLRDLQPAHLRDLYATLGARLAPKSVRNVHVSLSNALSLAVSDGYIARNVAKAREVAPTARSREMQVWTPEQIRTFLEFVVDDRLYALWRLAATTGMRRGEMMGLHWAAVDLDAARLRVDGALIVTPARELRFETPKTERSRRTVDLDAVTVDALRAHRKRQTAEQLASLGAWPADGPEAGLVFTDEVGRPLHPAWITRRFIALGEGAELPRIRLHDLRHSAATLLLRAGTPVHVVSQRLGHASSSITLDVYAHALDDQRSGAADAIAAAIDG
jgi:integrase